MKALREYLKFDFEGFVQQKDIRVVGSEPWYEYEDGERTKELGTKYKCIIAVDNTKYSGDREENLNAGEAIVAKVAKPKEDFKPFSKIKFIGVEASVYGSFQSELSVKADDVEITAPK